ncbi:EF-P 5-aminopentanol modification-associated protein YfmF [Weissella uvarum]|uniref:EF-P 5-aminopentanol modification-associated protein YfmF n=1 Tax=Weissella uvarum TaxID=1479233 RepID=UPI0019622482|nr:insulinase family protein [Weissella uvarum]
MLKKDLNANTHVTIQPTQQFSTIRIELNFASPVGQADFAQRALMAKMLEETSEKYQSQPALARALSALYGAEYGVDVLKMGALHIVKAHLVMIDERFTADGQSLLAQGLTFLKDMLTQPLGNATDGFDLTIFERQKDFLLDEMAALEDDRPYIANRHALNAYFDQAAQALPAYGTPKAVEDVTPQQAYQAFKAMWADDRLDILISGDVDENTCWNLVKQTFAVQPNTGVKHANLYYHQPVHVPVKTVAERQPVNQSQLAMIYQLEIAPEHRFAAYVFEAIFGGTPVSRLFMDVRETQGLAYTISTDYNRFTDVLLVSAGVASVQVGPAQAAIEANLKSLAQTLVTDEELAMVKQLMWTDFMTSLDNQSQVQDRAYVSALTGQSIADWWDNLSAVTPQAVQAVAKRATLQVAYVLKGTNEDAD